MMMMKLPCQRWQLSKPRRLWLLLSAAIHQVKWRNCWRKIWGWSENLKKRKHLKVNGRQWCQRLSSRPALEARLLPKQLRLPGQVWCPSLWLLLVRLAMATLKLERKPWPTKWIFPLRTLQFSFFLKMRVETTLVASTHILNHCCIAFVVSAFWPCLLGAVAPRYLYETETSLWEEGWWHLTSWRRDSPSMGHGKPWRAFPGLGKGHQVTRMRWEQEGSRFGSSPMLLRDIFFICAAFREISISFPWILQKIFSVALPGNEFQRQALHAS